MTKAEKAAFEALRVRAALSWPDPPPAPVSHKDIDAYSPRMFRGWWFNEHTQRVGEGVVVGHMHARENYTDEQIENRYKGAHHVSFSQGLGGPWYRSEQEALRAMHFIVARRFAEGLAAIERMIEAAAAK